MQDRFPMMLTWFACVVATAAIPGLSGALADETTRAASPATTVFIARHAEAQSDGTRNPPLTEAGKRRAEALARALRDVRLTAVYASQYDRTLQTAEPAAAAAGVEIERYAARDSAGLAERIGALPAGAIVLVLGHSNTVPAIVAALGGARDPDLHHDTYDVLYAVMLGPEGNVHVIRFRYGEGD